MLMIRFLLSRSFAKMSTNNVKLIDIGVNLTDPMYQGQYHGSKKHEPDLDAVLQRAWYHGVDKMIVTGGSLQDAKNAIDLSKLDDRLFATVGCHPTRCNEFEESASGPEGYLQDLLSLIKSNKSKVVAIGECGLDYERLNFCDMETQKKYFELQIGIIEQTRLPLFLHCRGAANDMIDILRKHADQLSDTGGVIHSFDGTWDEAKSLLDLGYYIGINGCSLKTDDNLEVLRQLPLDKLLIETDAPWCEIRPSHASSKYFTPNTDFNQYPVAKKPDKWKLGYVVKSRNEPCFIHHILDVICRLKCQDKETVAHAIHANTMKLFFSSSF